MEKKMEATIFIIVCIPGIPTGALFLRNSCVMVLFHFERSKDLQKDHLGQKRKEMREELYGLSQGHDFGSRDLNTAVEFQCHGSLLSLVPRRARAPPTKVEPQKD